MNKQILEQNLNEVVEALKAMLSTANTELPAIFEEIVRWGIVSSSVKVFISFTLMIGIFLMTFSKVKKQNYNHDDDKYIVCFFCFILSAVFLCLFVDNLDKFLFALTSPKLYVIQYLKDFF